MSTLNIPIPSDAIGIVEGEAKEGFKATLLCRPRTKQTATARIKLQRGRRFVFTELFDLPNLERYPEADLMVDLRGGTVTCVIEFRKAPKGGNRIYAATAGRFADAESIFTATGAQ